MGRRPHISQAAHALAVINRLPHTKGPFAEQPFNLRPWQVRILKSLFKTRKDGRRQYRTCLLMLPRKNGKTELAAALAVYFLMFDGEIGGEVYSAAVDRDQASLVFNVAAQMIRAEPELLAECDILDSYKRIVHRKSGSIYRVIAADAPHAHGFNASVVIYDELHAAPSRELWDVLASSTGARAQPLVMAISTAGFDRHSILWELYQHGLKVRETPALDPAFLPILYEAPADADWTSEKVWRQANPAVGDFRSLEEMQIACKRAQEIPAQENAFRRLYLNQWTEQAVRWLSLESWDACLALPGALDGRRCYVGLDLSMTKDLTAAVAVFPDDDGVGFDVLPAFFVPQERIKTRTLLDRVPYDEWARREVLTATPGPTVDYQVVRAQLHRWRAQYDVRIVAIDPYNARELIKQLGEDGFTVVEVRQTKASLSSPSKALEMAILERALRHDGHPILRWNIANAALDTDNAGNIQPSKAKSTERIDGLVALVMALDAMHRDATRDPSYDMFILGGPP